jgi:hypothetical protein
VELASRPAGPLLVSLADVVADVARERARLLLTTGTPAVLILTVDAERNRVVVKLRDAASGVPQSLDFVLPRFGDPAELAACLRQANLTRLELFDLGRLPPELLGSLLDLGISHDVVVAHADVRGDQTLPRRAIDTATHVWSIDREAMAIAKPLALPRPAENLDETAVRRRAPDRAGHHHLGLLAVRHDAHEHRFMRDVISGLRQYHPDLKVTVIGASVDDAALMEAGALAVTGPTAGDELGVLLRRYRIDCVLVALTKPLFGHPLVTSLKQASVPLAYLDWNEGQCPATFGDLPINPSSTVDDVVKQSLSWLEKPHRAPRAAQVLPNR